MNKGAITKKSILNQAHELASVYGLNALTIGSLAKSVGMSKSGLFAHFKSKENLQVETLSLVSKSFTEQVLMPVLKVERGKPRLVAFFNAWKAWLQNLPKTGGCVLIAASSEFDDIPGPVNDFLKNAQLQLIDSISRIVESGIEEGDFDSNTDSKEFAFEMFSLMLGYHYYYRLLEDRNSISYLETGFNKLLTTYSISI